MNEVVIRHIEPDDYPPIISVVDGQIVAFLRRMGFSLLESDVKIDGVPVAVGDDGEGEDRVIFTNNLNTPGIVRRCPTCKSN